MILSPTANGIYAIIVCRTLFLESGHILSGFLYRLAVKGGVHRLETFERRSQLWEKLRRRKYDKIENLAIEFGVSERTIRRDIQVLSLQKPIYTLQGRYGGVYVIGEAASLRYYDDKETSILLKLHASILKSEPCILTEDEIRIFEKLISDISFNASGVHKNK